MTWKKCEVNNGGIFYRDNIQNQKFALDFISNNNIIAADEIGKTRSIV